MNSFSVEVLCVGNELLFGRTLDSNSNFVCKRVYELGGTTKRITVVGDDVNEISRAIKETLARRADWLIVTGGLGPTYDDKTLQGLAEAMGARLSLSDKALSYVKESVRRRAHLTRSKYPATKEVLKAREKMATIPAGSEPLPNPVGTAPGVLALVDKTNVVCLPGVPAEMKAIFNQSVAPMMTGTPAGAYTVDIVVKGVPEASMAPLLESTARGFPDFYIKSHPASTKRISRVVVQVTGRGKGAISKTENAAKVITDWLKNQGASFRLIRSTKTGTPADQCLEDSHHSR